MTTYLVEDEGSSPSERTTIGHSASLTICFGWKIAFKGYENPFYMNIINHTTSF